MDKQFFITPEHDCSYLESRRATTLFLDPEEPVTPQLYQLLSDNGFRRSGRHLYRPHCANCQACMASRIPVAAFRRRRRHRRVQQLNQDLETRIEDARFDAEHYALFERYIIGRHGDGEMFPPSEEQYRSFLMGSWADTRFVCSYLQDELVAVAVTDRQPDGLSAIYTYFEPGMPRRSLGVHCVLAQIDWCRALNLSHLYLGYWIRESDKMAYKATYRPLEVMSANGWVTLP